MQNKFLAYLPDARTWIPRKLGPRKWPASSIVATKSLVYENEELSSR